MLEVYGMQLRYLHLRNRDARVSVLVQLAVCSAATLNITKHHPTHGSMHCSCLTLTL